MSPVAAGHDALELGVIVDARVVEVKGRARVLLDHQPDELFGQLKVVGRAAVGESGVVAGA